MKKNSICFILLVMVMTVFLSGCVDHYEYKKVEATVTGKHYHPAWISTVKSGKSTIPITHPAQSVVSLEYGKYTTNVDNKALYDSCKVGDKTTAYLAYGYSKEGKLEKTRLVFKSETQSN